MKLDIENWLKIIEPVALFPYQKHLWFIKSSWAIFIVNILEVSGETQRCNFTSRYGNYYLNDFGFFLYSETSQFKEIWKIRGLKTFSIFNKVNPHTPVAQKVADEVVFRRFQGEVVKFF